MLRHEILTHQSVLLHKGLSIYPLVDLGSSLVRLRLERIGRFAVWREAITENDLAVGDKRRKAGGEEDKR